MSEQFNLTTEQRRNYQDLVMGAFKRTGKMQKDVAVELGVSEHFVSDALHGPRSNAQLIPNLKLYEYLGIPYSKVAEVLGIRRATITELDDEETEILCRALATAPPNVREAVKLILR